MSEKATVCICNSCCGKGVISEYVPGLPSVCDPVKERACTRCEGTGRVILIMTEQTIPATKENIDKYIK